MLGLLVVRSSGRHWDFHGSELPMVESYNYSWDFWHTLVANPYMWLQIHANIHTTKVEEGRGRKKRDKNKGTLELGLRIAMEVVP